MIRRVIVFLLVVACMGWAQGKHPFTFEDMMALKRVGEPVVSPNGKWVAFSVVEVNLEQNKKTPHLWVVPLAGGEAKQISNDPAGEDRPRWSPDGKKIAFISAKEGGSQVWVADFDAAAVALGTPQKLTNISTEAAGELWSPDGKWILFTSEVYPDCPDDACNKARDEQKKQSAVKASIFRGLFFRHWSSYTGDKRTHIFIQAVEPTSRKSGEMWDTTTARDLTPGEHDAPPFSLGGQDMYAFSPDSQEVAFTSNIDEVEATSTNNEIFVVPVTGGTPRKISTSPGSDSTPLYSPDGKYIAWRMQETPGYESDRFQLVLYDRKSGQIRSLTKDFDRWVESFVWAPDSQEIYFTAEDKGESPIYLVAWKTTHQSERGYDISLTETNININEILRGHNDDLALTRDGGSLVFTCMTVQAPNEIYYLEGRQLSMRATRHDTLTGSAPDTATPVGGTCEPRSAYSRTVDQEAYFSRAGKLTHLNDSLVSQVSMQRLESFWFTGAANQKVQGFLVKPPNFDASKKYPVKFLIHGGPEGAFGDSWSYRWNTELMAASGYVVVTINFTGSTGYGQKFTQAIQGDWGGRPYQDLMLGLDYVEKTYPFIDKDRECALGASFGGYMANWILGHTTRFKCIVSHDGTFNTTSAYGTTEELWFPEWEFKGTPWSNRAMYDKWSPHLFTQNFKTPTLVVHGQRDYRLDVSQGFDLYTTLQRLKVPSKMLYFSDEGHWVLKPQNSQLWYKTVGEWVDSYLKK
ncbi:MAG: S9 family peptidase [Acidobacteriia bacterium]|nr:S9 family peptidase [Terriglobia bacterium]